jgi:tetratricopeptide (TPR) repeat protein
MIQAANDLCKAYPKKYDFLAKAADVVGKEYIKEKKFDQAAAQYQALVDVPTAAIAASARIKVGDAWLAAAKAMGAYQDLPVETRNEALKKLSAAEQSYLSTLKGFPDQLNAVGDAFEGLANALKQRRSWGLVTDADMEATLGKLTADLTSPEMQTRVELAKAGLVFVYKNGTKQYPAALERFRKAVNASPGLHLTRRETNQYGELLIAGNDYATATQVYTNLLAGSDDPLVQADGDYGLGAIYLAQGNVAKARDYFSKMTALPDGAAWHPHILDADYGLALADEQSNVPADIDKARLTYATLMQEPQAGILLQAKAMLGYGRLLEKAGHAITPAPQGPAEYAVHYYQQPHTFYGSAVPEQSAEGLFDAGQAYEKAGDNQSAIEQYTDLIHAYRQTAPDWTDKANTELKKISAGV